MARRIAENQKELQEFLKRRHPEYERSVAHWDFLEATYHGGREWFTEGNIFRYIKEGDKEFNDRLARAYRFNHTRESVDLVQKYIFKSPIQRNWKDAGVEVTAFWENATLSGLDIDQYMKLVSTAASIFGRVWVFVDSTKKKDVVSKADEKKAKARVYSYLVKPQNILDVGFDDHGAINWILVRETVRDDKDPIFSSGAVEERFRLWTRESWTLFSIQEEGRGRKKVVVYIEDEGTNALGEVPCFAVDHVIGENRYVAPGLINDIAYLDRAVANYLSNLDAIIQDQTFSQLAMPAQGILPGEDKWDKLLELGTKRMFVFDGEGGAKPEYISPDPKQAQIIITVINKIINEIYHTIGMAGERTKEDNAVGIDNSSGVAKAYDFERMNSLLTAKADSLENAENKLVRLVLAYHSKDEPEDELVKYPDTFDVRSLFDEFTIAEKLALIDAPAGVRQEQMKQVIDKLFPQIAKALREKMLSELQKWPVDPVERAAALAEATRPPTNFDGSKPAAKNPQTQNRQGQVTAKSPNKQPGV